MAVGAAASSRWLPDLAPGTAGGFAFVVVCGLLGAALATAGLQVYIVVRALELPSATFGSALVAGDLADLAWQPGVLCAAAAILYFIAPRLKRAD